mmetsp:Transcript_23/g.61  ORF Transcript_23/g.61 Transcript_23/m.61 type:complete len:299 (+) Transcript_23:436-1332(+)
MVVSEPWILGKEPTSNEPRGDHVRRTTAMLELPELRLRPNGGEAPSSMEMGEYLCGVNAKGSWGLTDMACVVLASLAWDRALRLPGYAPTSMPPAPGCCSTAPDLRPDTGSGAGVPPGRWKAALLTGPSLGALNPVMTAPGSWCLAAPLPGVDMLPGAEEGWPEPPLWGEAPLISPIPLLAKAEICIGDDPSLSSSPALPPEDPALLGCTNTAAGGLSPCAVGGEARAAGTGLQLYRRSAGVWGGPESWERARSLPGSSRLRGSPASRRLLLAAAAAAAWSPVEAGTDTGSPSGRRSE